MDKQTIVDIVKASGVKEGEMVFIHYWGENENKELADQFMCAVTALHATPVLLQQSRKLNRELFLNVDEHCFDDRYFDMLSHFDAVIDIFTYRPVVLNADIGDSQMKLYRRYMSQLFPAFMKSKRVTQIRIPTLENAQESGLEPNDFMQRMELAYAISYDDLKIACQNQIDQLAKQSHLTLCTGDHAKLHFTLTGRQWITDAGDGDMPCGEVFIAPLEDQTYGTVYYDDLFIEDLGHFTQVTIEVEKGCFMGADQTEVNQFINRLDPADRVVCELGLGMNPNITSLCGYTVLDEKMADTFHIAIGMNDMFGGQNHASVHIDLVGRGSLINENGDCIW
ncbi:aminopeptidase [Clostridiaceae bacterium DONG20-135]|uniref:Aminopeptidase n=1 Tax=Copranaerobaculum intestinale TaxID=2692629 RepID=A0A6N8U7H1_9FIRM|nr:aminopeptidase [Copranaerobaculum intestinale]MXQ73485.1 aminopeptidase [Copranaerobaculum intestinale]